LEPVRSLEIVLLLVVLATVVAAVAGRFQAPAPSLLVLAGLAVALVPGLPPVRLSPDIVSLVVLPPLLYAAGHDLSIKDLRQVWRPVTVLAVGLVLATATAVAGVATWLLGFPLAAAFVLGAVLASTDPVAVTALARTLRVPTRLETLVAAESLFNDATGFVLFRVAVGVVVIDRGVSWLNVSLRLVQLAAGGAIAGAVVALGVAAVRRRTDDPVLEAVITLVTPYVAYVIAEGLGASGVTAVIVAGLTVGSLRGRITSSRTRLQLDAVTGTVVFVLESVVFSLIGLALPTMVRALDMPTLKWLLPTLAITASIIGMRLVWVFPTVSIVQARRGQRPSWRVAGVATWAGTRGVVPLAAALSVPLTVHGGEDFPQRDLLLVVATTVCILTLVVQGLTLQPLTHRSGVAEGPEREQHEEAIARSAVAQAALERIESLIDAEAAPSVVLARLVRDLTERRDRARRSLDELTARSERHRPWAEADAAYLALRRDVLRTETATLARLRADGQISEAVWRRLQRGVDLEDTGLDEEER
jgi:Na+/H+ antiporter